VPTAEERTAPCDALGLEANSLIDATSAGIFREHTEPNSMCISILENDLNELHEQRLALAAAWMGNDHALDVGHAFGRRPITNDGKADCLGFEPGDEVSVSAISKRAPMLGLAPAVQLAPAAVSRLNGRAFATAYHIKSIESRVLRQGTITSEHLRFPTWRARTTRLAAPTR
jgi:hypothetical protein